MFEIRWNDEAEQELAGVWNSADSAIRKKLNFAIELFEEQLRNNPTDCGESRERDIRVFVKSPWAIYFRVHESRRTVHVLHMHTRRSK